MSGQYFVRLRGKVIGPFGVGQLLSLKQQGKLSQFHELSQDRVKWVTASSVKDVFPEEPITVGDPGATVGTSVDPPPKREWYYLADGDREQGPVALATLKDLRRRGEITGQTLVWWNNMADWQPFAECPQLTDRGLGTCDVISVRRGGLLGAGILREHTLKKWLVSIALFAILIGLFLGALALYRFVRERNSAPGEMEMANGKIVAPEVHLPHVKAGSGRAVKDLFADLAPSVPIVFARGSGSGLLIESNGKLFVATNRHVVEGATKGLNVAFLRPNKTSVIESLTLPPSKAKLVKIHREVDLALIDVSEAAEELKGWRLQCLTLASSKDIPSQGEYVFVIGHPGSGVHTLLPHTFTDGKVSAIREDPIPTDFSGRGKQIQMTAAINPGNSGGPVFNEDGKVIGISTWGPRTNEAGDRILEALNFAIHVGHLHELLADPAKSFTADEITALLNKKGK